MGSKALMLQVWADFSKGSLTFRSDPAYTTGCRFYVQNGNLVCKVYCCWDMNFQASVILCSHRICIDPNDDIKAGLLAQAESTEGLFRRGLWQHLGLTYSQQQEGKKNIHSRVVVWVCGIWWENMSEICNVLTWMCQLMQKTNFGILIFLSRKCEVSLDYTLPRKSSLSSDSNKTFCLLGHCAVSSEELVKEAACWSMGTVLLFNGKTPKIYSPASSGASSRFSYSV